MNNPVRLGGQIQFVHGFPFFEMVGTFMVAVSGSKSVFDKSNRMKWKEDEFIPLNGILSKGQHFYHHDIHRQATNRHIDQTQYIKSCCCMLANIAYESVKDDNDRSPEFEFLRHIRNAGSHRNKFHFSPKEPTSPASWGGATIEHRLNGTECFGTFIGTGDILYLLKDIETKVIQIRKNSLLNV
jgi:hypothetical protein